MKHRVSGASAGRLATAPRRPIHAGPQVLTQMIAARRSFLSNDLARDKASLAILKPLTCARLGWVATCATS